MTGRVVVFRDDAGEWRWQRLAGNNEIVSTSGEGYINKGHAIGMAQRLNTDCEVSVISEERDGSSE